MILTELLQYIAFEKIEGDTSVQISGICFDSRKVEKGSLFVATHGVTVDGHNYIDAAIKLGAAAIICEELPQELIAGICYIKVKDSAEELGKAASAWHGFPSKSLKLIGVTGTNGKTTIATLLYKLFRESGYGTGLLSTVKNYINDRAVEAKYTTPDAVELNELLANMVAAGCEYAFMEVSSHAVEQRRIAGLEFDGAVFTNLTRDHIDYHLTFENYLKAKKRFFDDLDKNAFALINSDDKNGPVMLQNCKAKKLSYSVRGMADFKTKILETDFSGMLLEMNNQEVHVPFIGNFNAYNLTAVYGTAIQLGLEPLEVLRIISSLKPVAGRFETIQAPAGFTAIVDYAHTPDALENVINTINDVLQGKGKLISVVGAGGNRDKGKRPLMAQAAAKGSWKVILTSDNPRDEEPGDIINDMLEGLDALQRAQSLVITDRREAIKTACALAQKEDVVLIAGKGHEDYQIIKGVKHHFDDREEVRKATGLI